MLESRPATPGEAMERSSAAPSAIHESHQVERVYAALARVYDGFFDWALRPGRREAVVSLPLRPGDRVLEVGVGTGLSLPVYPRECKVTGVDISEAMLERARRRLKQLGRVDGVELLRMDAHRLEFEDEQFDHVLAPYVISVVADPARVMQEMRRVCRQGGTLSVVNHFGSSWKPLAWAGRQLTPLTRWVGFRLGVPIETVTSTPGLELLSVRRVNLCGMWRLIQLRRVG